MQYELTTPCTAADLAPLKAGDTVVEFSEKELKANSRIKIVDQLAGSKP